MAEIDQQPGEAPTIAVTAPHTSIAGRIRNYFLTGLVVAGPLLVTAWLTWSFITWVDDVVRPLIPPAYRPESYLPWPIPGTGLIIAFVALTVLGFRITRVTCATCRRCWPMAWPTPVRAGASASSRPTTDYWGTPGR